MIKRIADNITSPLGFTTVDNYAALKLGRSALRRYEDKWNLPEPFVASLFSDEQWECVKKDVEDVNVECGYNLPRATMLAIRSVKAAAEQVSIDLSAKNVLFVISTTKGNVDLLSCGHETDVLRSQTLIGEIGSMVARYFKAHNTPIVVSNACISGLHAQITAKRALEFGHYDYAVVVGVDVQSKFIVSGFQSFKALSPDACRPFDKNRVGLNLGEAAATVIYQRVGDGQDECKDLDAWYAVDGVVRNDANHISGPSRTGEGSYRALRAVLRHVEHTEDLALINVHGTSTLYNDEMESIAIGRTGLIDVPVNTLKGYYGHTMGAAGVLEAVLSMQSIDDHTILGTRGFSEMGVSRPVNVTAANRTTDKQAFVKLLSGFGGCNAAMLFTKGGKL